MKVLLLSPLDNDFDMKSMAHLNRFQGQKSLTSSRGLSSISSYSIFDWRIGNYAPKRCPRILCISRHIVAGTREGLGVLIADVEDSSLLLLVVRVETAHEEVHYVAHCKLLRAKGMPFSHQARRCHTEVKYCYRVSLNKRGC